jgi:hypothetical protein
LWNNIFYPLSHPIQNIWILAKQLNLYIDRGLRHLISVSLPQVEFYRNRCWDSVWGKICLLEVNTFEREDNRSDHRKKWNRDKGWESLGQFDQKLWSKYYLSNCFTSYWVEMARTLRHFSLRGELPQGSHSIGLNGYL